MHCRDNLFHVFNLNCLSISNSFTIPPTFTVTLPNLISDGDDFRSSIRSIQSSVTVIPNVSGLFSNPRSISTTFTLLHLATFVSTPLQGILPDSPFGEISDWDHFFSIDLTSPNLPSYVIETSRIW